MDPKVDPARGHIHNISCWDTGAPRVGHLKMFEIFTNFRVNSVPVKQTVNVINANKVSVYIELEVN